MNIANLWSRRARARPVLAAAQHLTNGFSLPPLQNMTAQRGFTSLNGDTPFQLCFLRHGQSTWNRDNRFIGWTDTPLTDDGVLEARIAGQMLRQERDPL